MLRKCQRFLQVQSGISFLWYITNKNEDIILKLLIYESDIEKVTNLTGFRLFSHQRRKKSLVKLISKRFPIGSRILDVGCASGDIAVELSLRGYKVHGIDFEPNRLNKAKELANKYYQKVRYENKSFEELNSQSTYDIVLLGEVLEHFTDPVKTLYDIKYLLSAKGRVVITTPNMPSLVSRLKFALLGIFPDNNPEHKYYFDFRRFSRVVSDAGYETLYFDTRFTNIFAKSRPVAYIEHILLFWFSLIFPKSGDTIFAVISPPKSNLR